MVVTMHYEDAIEVFDTADRVDTALIRIGGGLANASRFAHAADVASVYAPQAIDARAFLERAHGDGAEGDPEEAICSMMGLAPGQYGTIERGMPWNQG